MKNHQPTKQNTGNPTSQPRAWQCFQKWSLGLYLDQKSFEICKCENSNYFKAGPSHTIRLIFLFFFSDSSVNEPIFTSLGLPTLAQCWPCGASHTALLSPCIQMVGKQYCFDRVCTINPSETLQRL